MRLNHLARWRLAAITYSHDLAIRYAANQTGLTLIIEDDVHLTSLYFRDRNISKFPERLLAVGEGLPPDWDILKVSWFGASSCQEAINPQIHVGCLRDDRQVCFYCGTQ